MTWPAPTLPIDFTNATAQQDLHPDAHNVTNQTLNDDYRPELTRVGDLIDGTRTVYQGDDPAGNAVVVADTVRIRTRFVSRYQGSTILGRIKYEPTVGGFAFATRSTDLTTVSGTVTPYVGVFVDTTNDIGFPNGGILEVSGTAVFNHQGASGSSVAALTCGIGLPPAPFDPGAPALQNEPTSWPTTTSRTRTVLTAPVAVGGVDVGIEQAGLYNRWLFEIPANTPNGVWGWLGVLHPTGPALVVSSGAVMARAWAD